MKDLDKIIKLWLIDEISYKEGLLTYGADLALELTEEINQQGFVNPYDKEARDWCLEHFEDINFKLNSVWDSEISDYIKKKFWDDPKGFQTCVYIETVRDLLAQCPTVDSAWNEKIELDEDTIQQIIKELEAL